MTTDDMIKALRDLANNCEERDLVSLFNEAADRLEELDERVAIMTESMDADWGNGY